MNDEKTCKIKSPTDIRNLILNFNKYFTSKRRLRCHILFWIFFGIVYFIDYRLLNSSFSLGLIAVYVVRDMLEASLVFYFISYFVIPKYFFRKKYFVGFLMLVVSLLIAPLIQYLSFSIAYHTFLSTNESAKIIYESFSEWKIFSLSFINFLIPFSFSLFSKSAPAFIIKLIINLIIYLQKNNELQLAQYGLKNDNLQLELNFLKSQINPHFFFNTLNRLYSLIYRKDDKALTVITDLSEIMEYTLYETNDSMVSLNKEIDFIKHYISMECQRLNLNEQNIQLRLNEEETNMSIAPLLLFPFVENAFKYGFENGKGRLEILSKTESNIFSFYIKNSKCRTLIKHTKYSGIGLKNVKHRLELLYPRKHTLTFEDEEQYFAVLLVIILS